MCKLLEQMGFGAAEERLRKLHRVSADTPICEARIRRYCGLSREHIFGQQRSHGAQVESHLADSRRDVEGGVRMDGHCLPKSCP